MIEFSSTMQFMQIDRKLMSTNQRDILDGLQGVTQHLQPDLLNSLVMRLLNILQHTPYFHIKAQIQHRLTALPLAQLSCREQLINVVLRCMQGADQFTRITSLKIAGNLPQIFSKQLLVYHTVLNNLSCHQPSFATQYLNSIKCLTSLLMHSQTLTSTFLNNLPLIVDVYKIKSKVVVFILQRVQIPSHMQTKIISYCIDACKGTPSQRLRLLFNALTQHNASLLHIPQYQCLKIQRSTTHSEQEFLDSIYHRKIRGLTRTQNEVNAIFHYVNQNSKYILLYYYYLPSFSLGYYNRLIINKVFTVRDLKQLHVVGNLCMVKELLAKEPVNSKINIKIKIIIQAYVQLHIASEHSRKNKFQQLRNVCAILWPIFVPVVQVWYQISQILHTYSQKNIINQDNIHLVYQVVEKEKSKNNLFFNQFNNISYILNCLLEQNNNIEQMQKNALKWYPEPMLTQKCLWFAIMSKSTVLRLFKI